MVEGKLSFVAHAHNLDILPFIDAGIGPSWSRARGYTETVATPDGSVSLPGFQSHTMSHFAYQVGGGLGYSFNFTSTQSPEKHERLSLGYRYVGLVHASFGTRGAKYPYALNLGRFSIQDVYLTFTHLI